jgi:hypothetical protein
MNNRYNSLPSRSSRRQFSNNPQGLAGSYAGVLSTPFIAPALKTADTLVKGYVRQIDGISYKAVLSATSIADNVIQAGGASACAFSDGDSVTLSESILTLTDLKVNEELCRATMLNSWQQQLGPRNSADWSSPEYRNFVMGQVAAKTAQGVENNIWKGSSVFANGFLSSNGTFGTTGFNLSSLANATTQAIAAMTASNVLQQIGLVYNKAATDKSAILSKPDLKFFVSNKTAALYRQAIATAGGGIAGTFDSATVPTTATTNGQGYNNMVTNQAFTTLNFLGIQIAECPGMFDDAIVLAQSENLVVGSNMGTDYTQASYIQTYLYDGSDNVRVTMRFGLGTVAGIATDVIVGKTF